MRFTYMSRVPVFKCLVLMALMMAGAGSARAEQDAQFRPPQDSVMSTTPSAGIRYDHDDGSLYGGLGGGRGLAGWPPNSAQPVTTETGKLTCICARNAGH